MKKFLLKVGVAIAFFLFLIVTMYFVLHGISKKTNACNNGFDKVFIWGDSQMFYGLDVQLLDNYLEKRVLSSARRGSGVYDFLISEKNIPDNSTCVVSFSECALLRDPKSDYNRKGHELSCLQILLHAGCSMQECLRIEKLNRRAINYNAFNAKHELIAYKDSIRISEKENISFWHRFFEEYRDWFSWKARSYKEGIQHLYDKQSQLMLVQFPFDKQVESFAGNSINRHLTDSLKEVLIKDYALKYEEIVLDSDSLLMHDLSHMNEVGARLATIEIADILRADTVNNYFIKVMIR